MCSGDLLLDLCTQLWWLLENLELVWSTSSTRSSSAQSDAPGEVCDAQAAPQCLQHILALSLQSGWEILQIKTRLSPKTKSFVLLITGFLPTAIHRNSHSIFCSIFGINTSGTCSCETDHYSDQQKKKSPTSLSFLTIIILLIYFTRLQLKSFKYKLFFLYRKCNKVKIVPCVIHSIIAMLTKFCIECARIDVIWYKKALYFPTQPHTYIN